MISQYPLITQCQVISHPPIAFFNLNKWCKKKLDIMKNGSTVRHTMKRQIHHFTERQIRQLKALSRITGLTKAELVRRAIDEYLERKNESMQNENQDQ